MGSADSDCIFGLMGDKHSNRCRTGNVVYLHQVVGNGVVGVVVMGVAVMR